MLCRMVSGCAAASGLGVATKRSEAGSTSGENTYAVAVCSAGCGEPCASSEALRIAVATSAWSFSSSASVSTPSRTSRRANVRRQSLSASASRLALGLYLLSSSDIECEYGRVTFARTNAGPFRERHQDTASLSTRYDAIGSLPSTSSTQNRFGKFFTSRATLPPAVCTSTGTEIAYPLSSIRNSTGSFRLQAVFMASQNSPSLVVPSPAEQ